MKVFKNAIRNNRNADIIQISADIVQDKAPVFVIYYAFAGLRCPEKVCVRIRNKVRRSQKGIKYEIR